MHILQNTPPSPAEFRDTWGGVKERPKYGISYTELSAFIFHWSNLQWETLSISLKTKRSANHQQRFKIKNIKNIMQKTIRNVSWKKSLESESITARKLAEVEDMTTSLIAATSTVDKHHSTPARVW